jgi:hypothetical protein
VSSADSGLAFETPVADARFTRYGKKGSHYRHHRAGRLVFGGVPVGQPKTKFDELVKLMVEADMKLLQDHQAGKTRVTG